MIKRIISACLIVMLTMTALCACVPEDPAKIAAASSERAEREERKRFEAEQRGKFAGSDLRKYAEQYTVDVFKEIFPDKDPADYDISVSKDAPTIEETAVLNGDYDLAFEMFRTGNFMINFINHDNVPIMTNEERDTIMKAFADRKFTCVIILSNFWEDDYIVDGEIHIDPRPMY